MPQYKKWLETPGILPTNNMFIILYIIVTTIEVQALEFLHVQYYYWWCKKYTSLSSNVYTDNLRTNVIYNYKIFMVHTFFNDM